MKNCFNLKCGEEEITLLKRDVKFSNGYGIVRALVGIYDEEDNFGLAKCLAVVDSNFKEAIPFMEEKDVLEILILNKGNILIKLLNDDEEIHFTFRAADIKFFAQLNCLNFFKVDNNIVQLEQIFDNWAKFALYDVNEKKLISDFYNVIGSFIYNSRLEQEVALANYYILDEHWHGY